MAPRVEVAPTMGLSSRRSLHLAQKLEMLSGVGIGGECVRGDVRIERGRPVRITSPTPAASSRVGLSRRPIRSAAASFAPSA